ncbi:MAG: PQQ-binding-like beta-propeller repeat protein [Limnohabitans sp.]|nr:PQQ-binding-like beta-propeller repeat protein [Limnohabitans sp.]
MHTTLCRIRNVALAALCATLCATTAAHADWSNIGGGPRTNGLSSAVGPSTATQIWSRTNMSCLISYMPLISGNRVFMVRQTYAQAPYNPPPGEARVHCLDLQTGATLWTFDCPFESGDWTTVVYGAHDGRVYVGRGGNGSSSAARVYCLNAATGAVLWISTDEVRTGSYDGIVFMDNGDPIFASHLEMRRLDAQTGATVWFTTRTCSVSDSCGPAREGDAIYVDEVAPGGQKISRFSATTGQRLYSSQTMPGFLNQCSPFCAPGGLVFYLRASNEGPTNDRFYAFRDTGSGFETLWNAQAYTEPFARHAITPDGGVTMLGPDGRLQIRDQLTGTLRAQSVSPVLSASGFTSSMVTVDALGRIFHNNSNGAGGSAAQIRSFDPSLSERWSLSITGVSQGGPSLASDGSLVLAGTGVVRRYWTAPPCVPADLNCDGAVDATDLSNLLVAWGPCGKGACSADIDDDGSVGAADLSLLLASWG